MSAATPSQAFADEVVPLLRADLLAVHEGDIGPRLALWSRREPVTLFGAWMSGMGWEEIAQVFERLSDTFRESVSFDLEVIAAECIGDLGYVVALERTSAVLDGGPRDYTLRVTTILRREDGAWKVVHRHADEVLLRAP